MWWKKIGYSRPTLVLLVLLAVSAAPEVFTGLVTSVKDGDTITVLRNGKPTDVRLYGIDAPEPGQDYGPRAHELVSALAFQETVIVTVQEEERDPYGRTIAYVAFPDGRVLNEEVLKAGLAWWNKKYAPGLDRYREIEEKARKARIGLWKDDQPVPPWEWREWQWVASRNSTIYHPASCPSIKVIDHYNEVRFLTEKDAKASGRTHCKCQK